MDFDSIEGGTYVVGHEGGLAVRTWLDGRKFRSMNRNGPTGLGSHPISKGCHWLKRFSPRLLCRGQGHETVQIRRADVWASGPKP